MPDILGLDDYKPGLFEANDAIIPYRDEAVARTQAMQRTDPMLAGNLRSERAATIGARVRMAYRPDYKYLGLDTAWQDEISHAVECLFELEMEDPINCYNDATGMDTLSGQLGLCEMEWQSQGEVLGVFQPIEDSSRPFTNALQLVDASRLITPAEFVGNASVKSGIRVNRLGRPTTWYIAKEHPYGLYRFSRTLRQTRKISKDGRPKKNYTPVTKQYDWGMPKLFHFFDRERVGQNRAVPHISSALRKMKGLQEYDDVTLQAAYRDAVFAVWLESQDPNVGQAFSHPGGHRGQGGRQKGPDEVYKDMHMAQQEIRQQSHANRHAQLGGRDLTQLVGGETVKALQGGFDRSGQKDFVKSYMWHFAAALGKDPATWSGDYTDQSFSSINAALNQTLLNRSYNQDRLLTFCGTPPAVVWLEEKIARGDIDMPIVSTRRRAHLNFFYKYRAALSIFRFYGPGQLHLDEVKGQKAWESKINNAMGTRTQYFRNHTNITMREYLDEADREERLLRDRGLEHKIGIANGKGSNTSGLPETQNGRVAQEE